MTPSERFWLSICFGLYMSCPGRLDFLDPLCTGTEFSHLSSRFDICDVPRLFEAGQKQIRVNIAREL
jgi:hypothetical protein